MPPQAYLVERLGGTTVTIHTLIKAGQDPHTYEPTPRQATDLARAQLFFTVDMPFEKHLVRKAIAGNPGLAVVDSTAGIPRLPMGDEDHRHAGQGAKRHTLHDGQPDPHVWLTPANLAIMARTMATAMMTRHPGQQQALRRNLATLESELAGLDQRIAATLAPYQGQTFYVFHPAFAYFAKAYGLRQKAVETGGKAPTPRQLAVLIRKARKDRVRVIFVQPQFDPRSGEAVARAIGGSVTPIDPLAHDMISNLAAIAGAMDKAFAGARKKGPPGQLR